MAESVLYSFLGEPDGFAPGGDIVVDRNGTLFGTTLAGGMGTCFLGCGTVFRLSPGPVGYSESVLHAFASGVADGATPTSGLVADASGALFGTTEQGGSNGVGTVFKLTPHSGVYAESVIHSFHRGDGAGPEAGLLLDPSGNLYGTTTFGGTAGFGTAFEITPTATGYQETVLHSFGGIGPGDGSFPQAALISDSAGALYGTAEGGGAFNRGTVFKLTPTASGYSESILYSFRGAKIGKDGADPIARLFMDATGRLFGTDLGGGFHDRGAVFALTPSSHGYRERILYRFAHLQGKRPATGIIADANGTLYGTTEFGGQQGSCSRFCGTIFALTPSHLRYVHNVVHFFDGVDGENPAGALVPDGAGGFFGTTAVGGATGNGVVFRLGP
jgi:uncharacterized repeat protein (TIGR03803 family)